MEKDIREYLLIDHVAAHLSVVLKEEITEADVLHFVLDKRLNLSVRLPYQVKASLCRIFETVDEARENISQEKKSVELLETSFSESVEFKQAASIYINPPEVYRDLPAGCFWVDLPSSSEVLYFPNIDVSVDGVVDLPMIGDERAVVERALRTAIIDSKLDHEAGKGFGANADKGVFFVKEGQLYQLQVLLGQWEPARDFPEGTTFLVKQSALKEFIENNSFASDGVHIKKSFKVEWILNAREKGKQLKKENPSWTLRKIATEVRKFLEENNVSGRGGKIPAIETIEREALQNLLRD